MTRRRASWAVLPLGVLGMLALGGPGSAAPPTAPVAKPAIPRRPDTPVTPVAPPRPATAAPRGALLPFYQALETLERHRRTTPVTILQIGDSHTANDGFSGRMRELFQQRFGDGGRGLLPAGIAFKTYSPAEVTVTAEGWTLVNSFDPGTTGPFGISGLRQHAEAANQTMTLTLADSTVPPPAPGPNGLLAGAAASLAEAAGVPAAKGLLAPAKPPARPPGADRATVELLRQPDGGRVQLQIDGKPRYTFRTEANQRYVDWIGVALPPGTRSVALKTLDGKPVDVLSWSLGRRAGGGVAWANHGTIGATVDLVARWDPTVVAMEMRQLQPSLIVVAFGTNEGFQDSANLETYPARYAAALNVLKAGAPGAAVAIMGPPDGNRLVNGSSEGGGTAADCVARVNPASTVAAWVVPPKLPLIRQAQAQLAERSGAFFFDWSAAMGGACSMHRWTLLQPPLGQPDHVHLRSAGYRQTAETFYQQLMAGYDDWKAGLRPR